MLYQSTTTVEATLKPDPNQNKFILQTVNIFYYGTQTPVRGAKQDEFISFNYDKSSNAYIFTLLSNATDIQSLMVQFGVSDMNTDGWSVVIVNQLPFQIQSQILWPNQTIQNFTTNPNSRKTYPFPSPVSVSLIVSMARSSTNASKYYVSQLTAIDQMTEQSIPFSYKDFDTKQINQFYEYSINEKPFQFILRDTLPRNYVLKTMFIQLGNNPNVDSSVLISNKNKTSILLGLSWSVYGKPYSLQTNICGGSNVNLNYLNQGFRDQLRLNPTICSSTLAPPAG